MFNFCEKQSFNQSDITDFDVFIVMFDYTSKTSYFHAAGVCNNIRVMSKTVPIIVCGTKCDRLKEVKYSKTKFQPYNVEFCTISQVTGNSKLLGMVYKMFKEFPVHDEK